MKQKYDLLAAIGLCILAVGIVVPLIQGGVSDITRIIFSIGAVVCLVGRILGRPGDDQPLRLRRLLRLQIWSGIFFCVAAFFIWYSRMTTDWLAFTLAGGLVQAYVSIAVNLYVRKHSK